MWCHKNSWIYLTSAYLLLVTFETNDNYSIRYFKKIAQLLLLISWRARQALPIWGDKNVPKRRGIPPDSESRGIRLSLVIVESHFIDWGTTQGRLKLNYSIWFGSKWKNTIGTALIMIQVNISTKMHYQAGHSPVIIKFRLFQVFLTQALIFIKPPEVYCIQTGLCVLLSEYCGTIVHVNFT